MQQYNRKTSYGVAMCRYNKNKNNRIEILMIKKRYTYHYFSFVFGQYNKYNNKQLQYLFNNMTFSEKIDILSMDFSTMWYRLWLSNPEKNYNIYNLYKDDKNNDKDNRTSHIECYFRKKEKFELIFLKDSGKRLRGLINNSSNSVTPWEIPRGSKKIDELDINCAIREFEEETGIYSDKYSILWDTKPIIASHKDENIIYKGIYYIAYINKASDWTPKINFETANQLSEVEQIQWISLEEINFLNLNKNIKQNLVNLFKKIISVFKINIKSYYYD